MVWSFQPLPDMTDEQFARWQGVLEERTGINFGQHKSILQSGLVKRMREVGCHDYDAYYTQVCGSSEGRIEWTALLNTLTVGETSFFRHPEAFAYLRKYLMQRLLETGESHHSLDVWSVGCSTGEEAYSLAMVVNDCVEGLGMKRYFGVTGSDICLAALAHARAGKYRQRRLEHLDSGLRQRYFEAIDDRHGQVVDWLRQRVCFVQANMLHIQDMPIGNMDVIFCQNVLVYFRRPLQQRVLDHLVSALKPGGLLIMGLGETVGWHNPLVQRVPDERIQAYLRKQAY